MKRIALAMAGVLVVALAVAVAKSLSSEVMAVVVGVACGIGASIPCAFAMIAMSEYQDKASEKRSRPEAQPGRQLTMIFYGPVAIGDGARSGQAGVPFNGRQYYLPQVDVQGVLGDPRGEQ